MQKVFHGITFGRFYFSFHKDKGREFLSAVFAKHETFNFGAGTGAITSSTNLTFDDTDLSLAGAGKMEFRDTGAYIHSTDTNDLEIVATDMEITATNIILDAGTSIALEQDTTVTGDLTTTGNIYTSGYSYSDNYESLCSGSFKISSLADGTYGMPGNQGTSNTNWGFEYTNGASGLGNTSQHIGHVVPYDCVLVGVVGKMRATSAGNWSFSLWSADLVDGTNAASQTWTESINTVPVNQSSASRVYRFATTTGTTYLEQGDSIIPTALNGSGTESDVYGSYTIMIKRVN